MLGCFADENVHGGVISALRIRGLEVVTAHQCNLAGAPDESIATEALGQRRILLTNDIDFLRLLAESMAIGKNFPPLIFWPQQSRSIGELLARIIPLAQDDDYDLLCDRVFFV